MPDIKENRSKKVGSFLLQEVDEIIDDLAGKINPPVKMDARLIDSVFFQMATTLPSHRIFLKNKNILFIYEGLLHILNRKELKAVIAHEIGHHLAPKTWYSLHKEYWADYYACKYDDPVALANALIKIDQNMYFLYVLIHRCTYLSELRIEKKHRNLKMWEYVLENIELPIKSKRDANKQAKRLILSYMENESILSIRRHFIKRFFFILQRKFKKNSLNRKELAKYTFVEWRLYDKRIQNKYLDKYELLELYQNLKQDQKVTVSRYHYKDSLNETHPNINRRLVFMIENCLL